MLPCHLLVRLFLKPCVRAGLWITPHRSCLASGGRFLFSAPNPAAPAVDEPHRTGVRRTPGGPPAISFFPCWVSLIEGGARAARLLYRFALTEIFRPQIRSRSRLRVTG